MLKQRAEPTTVIEDTSRTESRVDSFLRTHLSRIVVALAVFAAIRILVFAAAFPLTNNTDERFHLMTIQMFAEGNFPGKELPPTDPQFARSLLLYWSPEYALSQADLQRNAIGGPLCRLPRDAQDSALARGFYVQTLERWLRARNFEAQSPPLYYLAAAGWYKLGRTMGFRNWSLGYWVRFLNPIAYALLVWFSYKFVRTVYPERPFLCLAVPALIAVFPQDVFFGMNRDVLSPPICAAALLLMVESLACAKTQLRSLLLASFLVGLAFLVEVSNCVLYGSLAATLWTLVRRSQDTGRQKVWLVSTSAAAALLFPVLWMSRNYLVIGDLTGSRAKMRYFGWTGRPLVDLFRHPLFSWHGLRYFLVNLTRTFWHGEYEWRGVPMRSAGADWFYVISSAALVLVFAISFAWRRKAVPPLQRVVAFQALALFASSVLFMAAISLAFDFHDTAYPSRLHPYFVSGRIISGALLPFVFIYVSGLELVVSSVHRRIPPVAVLVCLVLFITISEFRVRSVVLSSPYNFLALSTRLH